MFLCNLFVLFEAVRSQNEKNIQQRYPVGFFEELFAESVGKQKSVGRGRKKSKYLNFADI